LLIHLGAAFRFMVLNRTRKEFCFKFKVRFFQPTGSASYPVNNENAMLQAFLFLFLQTFEFVIRFQILHLVTRSLTA